MNFQIDYSLMIRDIDIMLWIIGNVFTLINIIITLRRFFNKKFENSQRISNLIWSLYFLFMLSANILSILWRRFILEIYGVELAKLLENISMIFLNCGWLILVGYFDIKRSEKKRPYFFIILIIIFPFSILINFHLGQIIEILYFIAVAIGFSIVPILFIKIARHSEGIIRKNSFRLSGALITFGIGLLIQQQNVEPFVPQVIYFFDNVIKFPYLFLSPILISISMIIFYISLFQIYGIIEE